MTAAQSSPMVLGRYELHAAIAHGGMASIHLGRLRGPVGFARTVAIKRLHPHYAADANFVAMFSDEARLVARIQHPNVVPIVDVVAEEGELFLVMDYVHGESLARLVHDRGIDTPVPPPIAAAIFADVLHGLHAAHEAKTPEGDPLCIVHRDVTPHNVLVGVDGAARIADFGIAKATQRAQSTQQGQLKGKLCYVAPEQIKGENAGRASDVYAAAVSLWEALTGRVLFDAENEARILERVMIGATRSPSAVVPGIPPELDDIVMRGLEMKPMKRFPTARDMALALEKSVALPPASEIGAWVGQRAHEALAKRSAFIEVIDRAPSASTTPAPRTPVPATSGAPSLSPPPASGQGEPPAIPASGARGPLLTLLALLALGALTGAAFFVRARSVQNARANGAPSSSAAWADYEPSPSSPDPQARPPSTSQATRIAPRPTSPRAPRGAPSGAQTLQATQPAPPGENPCKMPYTRDDAGSKIYKRECL